MISGYMKIKGKLIKKVKIMEKKLRLSIVRIVRIRCFFYSVIIDVNVMMVVKIEIGINKVEEIRIIKRVVINVFMKCLKFLNSVGILVVFV